MPADRPARESARDRGQARDPGTGPRWVGVIAAEALREAVPVAAEAAGRQIVLLRHRGRIHAVERRCPHEGADLAQGWCAAGRLHCPRHQASFDLCSGLVSPGWPTRALGRFAVRVEDGVVHVGLPA